MLVERCQISGSRDLRSILFLGFLPPVNTMAPIGSRPAEQPAYPAELLYCPESQLVQLGLVVDPAILFPPHYAYTSGTTQILRENFAELQREVASLYPLKARDLVVDIGSNDGTLLEKFQMQGQRVCGIEPTQAGKIARKKKIQTLEAFFGSASARQVVQKYGRARVITATNVFAHMENIHELTEAVLLMLEKDGLFITESHYLLPLLETLQYDTIYHEHLRYYSLHSLRYLLEKHGLEVIHARRIPTHGGSIRVYAARKGLHKIRESVPSILREEKEKLTWQSMMENPSQEE